MFFNDLEIDDQKYLVESFTQDGFSILEKEDRLVISKKNDTIVIDELSNAKFYVDFANLLNSKNILTNDFGGLDINSLTKFLKNEKKPKEDVLDCLKRTAPKFNWQFVFLGEMKINNKNDDVRYLELATDSKERITLLVFNNDKDKIYAINRPSFFLSKILAFDERDYLRELAPEGYLALQALGG